MSSWGCIFTFDFLIGVPLSQIQGTPIFCGDNDRVVPVLGQVRDFAGSDGHMVALGVDHTTIHDDDEAIIKTRNLLDLPLSDPVFERGYGSLP